MANSRVVVNPFTKNESRMRRNTSDSRWVSDNSARQQAGPGKTAQFMTQHIKHVSHTPAMSANSDEISPKARTRYPPLSRIRTSSAPVSPPLSNRAFRRDSPVSAIGPIDFSHSGQRRKSSEVTVFPYYPSAIKRPEPKSNQTWCKQGLNKPVIPPTTTSGESMADEGQASTSLTGLYRTAKDIYQVGPKGEGQKVWESYKQFRKEKQAHTEARQAMLTAQADERPQSAPQLPAAAHPAHPALPGQSHTGRPASKSPFQRKNTGLSEGAFSRSSYEVPLSMDKSIHQVVDLNKPLPPVPRLDPAPRTRHPMNLEDAFKVGIAAASIQQPPTQRQATSQRPVRNQHVEKDTHAPHSTSWWRALADKQLTKSHAALKAKISHVRPLAAFNNGRTANVAPECGGVGRPATASSLPSIPHLRHQPHNSASTSQAPCPQVAVSNHTHNAKQVKRPPPLTLVPQNRQKGKQKASHVQDTPPTHWRDVFDGLATATATGSKGRKRKDSDASFKCQGLEEEKKERGQDGWVRDPGPSTQVQKREVGGGKWDTEFYGDYFDVLGEY